MASIISEPIRILYKSNGFNQLLAVDSKYTTQKSDFLLFCTFPSWKLCLFSIFTLPAIRSQISSLSPCRGFKPYLVSTLVKGVWGPVGGACSRLSPTPVPGMAVGIPTCHWCEKNGSQPLHSIVHPSTSLLCPVPKVDNQIVTQTGQHQLAVVRTKGTGRPHATGKVGLDLPVSVFTTATTIIRSRKKTLQTHLLQTGIGCTLFIRCRMVGNQHPTPIGHIAQPFISLHLGHILGNMIDLRSLAIPLIHLQPSRRRGPDYILPSLGIKHKTDLAKPVQGRVRERDDCHNGSHPFDNRHHPFLPRPMKPMRVKGPGSPPENGRCRSWQKHSHPASQGAEACPTPCNRPRLADHHAQTEPRQVTAR